MLQPAPPWRAVHRLSGRQNGVAGCTAQWLVWGKFRHPIEHGQMTASASRSDLRPTVIECLGCAVSGPLCDDLLRSRAIRVRTICITNKPECFTVVAPIGRPPAESPRSAVAVVAGATRQKHAGKRGLDTCAGSSERDAAQHLSHPSARPIHDEDMAAGAYFAIRAVTKPMTMVGESGQHGGESRRKCRKNAHKRQCRDRRDGQSRSRLSLDGLLLVDQARCLKMGQSANTMSQTCCR